MKTVLCGIGWIENQSYGSIKKQFRSDCQEGMGVTGKRIKEILSKPLKNFGRFDIRSKSTCYAVALALKDSDITFPLERKEAVGIVATNKNGCLESDLKYFKDYVDCGRTLGRSNYFAYTLPTAPISEAAIYFGLQGPLLFAEKEGDWLAGTLELASEIINMGEASIMLAGMAEGDKALFIVLASESEYGNNALCSLEEATGLLDICLEFSDVIKELESLINTNEKGH